MDFAGRNYMVRGIFLLYCLVFIIMNSQAEVSHERLINADEEPGSWLTHGRNYAEDRQSPLTSINKENISKLGLAWYFDTGTTRGLEASPLIIDGVIYSTGSWSKVFANDAVSGQPLWNYDPQVPRAWGVNACCDVVNRGVAAWGDSIYFGSLDGRLIALDSATGNLRWETLTIDPARPYTITGAPRIINGKVIIGNGGAEYGVRGYVSAYDAESGELLWRFYTVPGDPSKPFESEAMRMAAKTWTGDVYYEVGGGGTVWDSMAYDPELNLLYFGVGNGSPWNRHIRSPEGGDNLFLSSIIAVNPDTGEYVWHYQTTPADSWDYTATQHIILADLTIANKTRKVLMQAPKNGFFYVIDRQTGELISAEKYTPVSWASHVDLKTGRPVETANANHLLKEQISGPMGLGGHNWHPMAFNKQTGLVYIPAMENSWVYNTIEDFQYFSGGNWNLGQKVEAKYARLQSTLPPLLTQATMKGLLKGRLIAWDPVTQKERWRVDHVTMWNGGLLTTQSGLVFQGTGDGRFVAYDAESGQRLWQTNTVTGVIAAPVSYEIDGDQYVAVMAGWGGGAPVALKMPGSASAKNGRLLVYKLGGKESLPDVSVEHTMPRPPKNRDIDDSVNDGANLYNIHCMRCHGSNALSGGIIADLRYMNEDSHRLFNEIVLGGILSGAGMVSFKEVLSQADADAIHDYIIYAANLKWEEDHSSDWWASFRGWFYEKLVPILVMLNSPPE